MKKKMWHCKSCGALCDASNGVCPECGLDLGFYGEVQFVEVRGPMDAPPPRPEKKAGQERPPEPEKPPKPEKAPREKREGGRSPLPAILGGLAVCVIAAAAVCLLLFRTKVTDVRASLSDLDQQDDGGYLLQEGDKTEFSVRMDTEGFIGSLPKLTVTSSDTDVVELSVNSSGGEQIRGTLRARSPGSATITAEAGGYSCSFSVEVYQLTGMRLTMSGGGQQGDGSYLLSVGETIDCAARLQFKGDIGEDLLPEITLTSSDSDVVDVDSGAGRTGEVKGTLTARGGGSAVITARAGDYEESVTVSVYEVTGVTLDCYDLLSYSGETLYWAPVGLELGFDVTTHYIGEEGLHFTCTVDSSDESVLAVDRSNFRITAVSPGTATITATVEGHSSSLTLEVYPVDRSSGAWIKGSPQSIPAPQGGKDSSVVCTMAICFGDGVNYISAPLRLGPGAEQSQTRAWDDASAQYPGQAHEVKSRDLQVTLKGGEWDSRRNIAGIMFLFKRADADTNDYNPATDLIDYWVIWTE